MKLHHRGAALALVLFSSTLFAVACSDDDDNSPTPAVDAGPIQTTDSATDTAPPIPDGGIVRDTQILAVLAAANTGEVDQGTRATSDGSDPAVVAYGQMMVMMHSEALQRGDALAKAKGLTPEPNPVSTQLEVDSATTLASLQGLTGAAFDKAYIDSQVAGHTKVLGIIDDQLLPVVMDADLRAELQTSRATVVMHLADAKTLQTALAADGGVDAGTDAAP